MNEEHLQANLEREFRALCSARNLQIKAIKIYAIQSGWQIDATINNRSFSFGTDHRDGLWVCERIHGKYMSLEFDAGESLHVENGRALSLSTEIIFAALSDPEFRGYKPRVI